MWTDPPASESVGALEHDDDHDTDEEETHAMAHPKGPQPRDENGFCYFGPAEKIHGLICASRATGVPRRTPCLLRATPTLPNNAMVAQHTTSAGR